VLSQAGTGWPVDTVNAVKRSSHAAEPVQESRSGGGAHRPALHNEGAGDFIHGVCETSEQSDPLGDDALMVIAFAEPRWYPLSMRGTFSVTVGNKGRVVLPTAIRARRNWSEGTTLIAIESPTGVVLTSREDAERVIREQLAGVDVVKELLDERRSAARAERDS
jgi:AbrB family looped-hinge helix DNA binding protein